MLSMTGYGSGAAPAGNGQVVIALRAVNHRYLDVRTKLSVELNDLTDHVEAVVRQRLGRGRIEISAKLDRPTGSEVTLAKERATAAIQQLRSLRDDVAPGEPLPLHLLSTLPGLFLDAASLTQDELRASLDQALAAALDDMDRMRCIEGQALARDLIARIDRISMLATDVEQRSPTLVTQYRAKLQARIAKLLADGALAADPSRLETEVAIFADRADVTEEITRLRAHCEHFLAIAKSNDAIGRKLDFLLQEMSREANTIGSKIGDAAVTHIVVEIKTELERVREQVQNVL